MLLVCLHLAKMPLAALLSSRVQHPWAAGSRPRGRVYTADADAGKPPGRGQGPRVIAFLRQRLGTSASRVLLPELPQDS